MSYGIQVSRTVNGVTRTSLDPQALGGRVFVSVETAAAGVSRTVTYDNILGGSSLKYYFLNAGSHVVTTSTQAGTGKAQLTFTAYINPRRAVQTQVIVFTTSTVEPSSGILTINNSGERTVSAVLPVPVFLGRVTMPTVPDYSYYIAEGGGYSDVYSATTSLGAGTDRLVLWTVPENGSNVYFEGDSYIPAAVTGNAIIYGSIYSTAAGTSYTVGEALIFSLSYIPSSTSTHGMRLFNSGGSLLFDSGNDHLYIKGFSTIEYSSTDTIIVNDSPDIYTGSLPAILIPNYFVETGTRVSNKLMSTIRTYRGAIRRQGTNIYTKRILTEVYNEDFAISQNYTLAYGSQYNTIFGIDAANLGAGSGTSGGTSLVAYIQASGTEVTNCVYDSNTASSCTISQNYTVSTSGGNGNALSYYWYFEANSQSHPGTFSISGSASSQTVTVNTTSGDTAGSITARLVCEVSQSGSTTVEAKFTISRVHQGYGELISITPSTLGWNSTGTISVKGTPNTSFTFQITNTSSQPTVFTGGPLPLDANGNYVNLSSKGSDYGSPAGLKYLWVKFSETNNVKFATVTTTAATPTINYFRVRTPSGSYSTNVTGPYASTPYFEWSTTDAVSVSITSVANTSTSASEVQGPTLYTARTFTLTATHSSGGTSTASVTYNVSAPTISLSPTSLPTTKVNNSYNQTITASGGRSSYSFSYTGSLPPGLSLSSGGTISGTPTSQGSYNFTVTATDADGYTGSRAYTIQVDAQNITPTISQFQIALIGPNNWGSSVSGGYGTTPQFRWSTTNASSVVISATSGNTSGSLNASSTGSPVLGSINAYGTTTITLTATSSTGDVATATVYFVGPSGPSISLSPSSLPGEYINRSYNQTVSASGGSAPYTYTHTAGTLPNGLSLSSGGSITGTTSATGTFTFTITATDASGYTGSQSYSITISSAPTITVSPSSLANGTVGTAYSQTISASGGLGPHSFAVTSGSVPTGLSLGVGGGLSGTPNTAGTYNFTVTATSADSFTGSQFYSVTISNAVVYNETFSNSTSTPTENVSFSITVTGGVPNTVARYRLGLGGAEQQVTLNGSGSYTWSNISLPAGTYTWYFSFDGSGNDRSHTVTVAAAPAPSGIVNPLGFNGGTYTSEYSTSATVALYVHADGIWRIHDDASVIADGNWWTPTTSSIGNNYWIRFTRNSASGIYGGSEPTTGWQQLNTVRSVYVNAYSVSSIDRVYTSNYTVEISSNSSGTNIVSSSTVTLRAIALGSGGIEN